MKLFLFSILALQSTQAGILYSTDFDDFSVGDNQWSANSDWATNSGADFIDDLAFGQALGNTAGLGFNRPNSDRVFVLTQIPHDHFSNGESVIEIDTLISIKDSSNNRRDDFYITIFNSSGVRMASIRFDNETPDNPGSNFGFWREDGTNQFDTNFDFIHEELYDLFMSIDLAANTWSASIGGIPLFENAPFTNAATGPDIEFAAVAYEWDISASSTALHGDNFLLVADLRVISKAPDQTPILEIESSQDDTLTLSWEGFSGKSYQVEYSDSLEENSWESDLPDSTFSTSDITERFQFTANATSNTKRFFRVVQSE